MQLNKRQIEIYRHAVKLIKEKGFHATSMRDLANSLQIKAASLYAHLNSKDDLLNWICFQKSDEFFEILNGVKSLPISPKEKLELFIQKHLEVVLKNRDTTEIYSHEWKYLKDNNLQEFINLRKNYQKEVEDLLKEAFSSLEITNKNSEVTTKFLLHTLNNSYLWYKNDTISENELVSEIPNLLLEGILGK